VSTAGVGGLLVISMIALAAPVLAVGVQQARVPDVVIEIVAGIVVGPSVLGWVKVDQRATCHSAGNRSPPTRAGQRRAIGSARSRADSQQSASGSVPVRTGSSRPRRTHSHRPGAAPQQVSATRLLQEDS
jgi:Sodium/hydrogen exchanger family